MFCILSHTIYHLHFSCFLNCKTKMPVSCQNSIKNKLNCYKIRTFLKFLQHSAMEFVGNYAPCGPSSQTDSMPAIQNRTTTLNTTILFDCSYHSVVLNRSTRDTFCIALNTENVVSRIINIIERLYMAYNLNGNV